jgi:hypothetical protein
VLGTKKLGRQYERLHFDSDVDLPQDGSMEPVRCNPMVHYFLVRDVDDEQLFSLLSTVNLAL